MYLIPDHNSVFHKGIGCFFFHKFRGTEYKKLCSVNLLKDNNSICNQGKSVPSEKQNMAALNWAAQY